MGGGLWLRALLTSSLDGSAHTPAALTQKKKPRYPLDKHLCESYSQPGRGGEEKLVKTNGKGKVTGKVKGKGKRQSYR